MRLRFLSNLCLPGNMGVAHGITSELLCILAAGLITAAWSKAWDGKLLAVAAAFLVAARVLSWLRTPVISPDYAIGSWKRRNLDRIRKKSGLCALSLSLSLSLSRSLSGLVSCSITPLTFVQSRRPIPQALSGWMVSCVWLQRSQEGSGAGHHLLRKGDGCLSRGRWSCRGATRLLPTSGHPPRSRRNSAGQQPCVSVPLMGV
jgi:hypothetical protein